MIYKQIAFEMTKTKVIQLVHPPFVKKKLEMGSGGPRVGG